MAKVEIKTKPTNKSAATYLNEIEDPQRKTDCKALDKLMRKVSGKTGKIWGDSIVGYGSKKYYRSTGAEGDWFPIGFSNRKQAITIYATCDLAPFKDLLAKLGKHKAGRGCLYIKKLDDIDLGVLEALLKQAIAS